MAKIKKISAREILDSNKYIGFTLVELLVVISIIALLSSITVYLISSTRVKARIAKAQYDIKQIHTAIRMLANDTNEWPRHQSIGYIGDGSDGDNELCATDKHCWLPDVCYDSLSSPVAGLTLNDFNSPPDHYPYPGWKGPYMEIIPVDPWGNEYFFDTDYGIDANGNPDPSSSYYAAVIGSYGPNGSGNNCYDSDDIIKIIAK